MMYALISVALLAASAVALFVWTAVRSAVEQVVSNRRAEAREAALSAHWTTQPEVPFTPPVAPTYSGVHELDEVHRRAY